jgi:cell wall-associated NlpC family hydrolase
MAIQDIKLIKPNSILTPSEFRQYKVICAAIWCMYNTDRIGYGHVRGAELKKQFRAPPQAPHELDCSSFITYCFNVSGCPDPNGGIGYSGGGSTESLWVNGTLVGGPNVKQRSLEPGDVMFFSVDSSGPMKGGNSEHVSLYIDDGSAISHGSAEGPLIVDFDKSKGKNLIGARRYAF